LFANYLEVFYQVRPIKGWASLKGKIDPLEIKISLKKNPNAKYINNISTSNIANMS
jgi:hypothetical protein